MVRTFFPLLTLIAILSLSGTACADSNGATVFLPTNCGSGGVLSWSAGYI